jgi:hypothetical protein
MSTGVYTISLMNSPIISDVRTVTLYITIVAVTAGLWVGLGFLRQDLNPCDFNCQGRTFLTSVRHDPYCIVDPGCPSPFYQPTATPVTPTPQWEGYYWIGGSGATPGSGWALLAIPNYFFFLALFGGLAALVQLKIHRPLLRRLLLTSVLAWVSMEVVSWYYIIAWYDPTVPMFNGELIVVLGLSLVTIWGVTRWSRHLMMVRVAG